LPADTKRISHFCDRPPIYTVTPEHLIAHLYQVTRIKKLMTPEGFIFNGLRVRMKRSLITESGGFRIILLNGV